MTRSYGEELAVLSDAYSSSLAVDVFPGALGPGSSPLLAVGSGGSGTVARYVADVHRASTGAVTAMLTPLGVVSCPAPPPGTRVVLISAGGSNADVLAAWERISTWEGAEVVVLCGESESALARAARAVGVPVVPFDRHGEESFVACSSLLAPSVVAAVAVGVGVPQRYDDLVGPARGDVLALGDLWGREILVALHGADGAAAAHGLESNFTEAAVGTVAPCDYRNLAHGRYLWLERQGPRTGILTLESEADRSLADATVRIIGDRVPLRRVRLAGRGPVAGLRALAAVLEITALAGEARGIDPARPGSDSLGPALYDLGMPATG